MRGAPPRAAQPPSCSLAHPHLPCTHTHTHAPTHTQVTPGHRVVLLEGNYLLLPEDPWVQLRELVDDTWCVSTDALLLCALPVCIAVCSTPPTTPQVCGRGS